MMKWPWNKDKIETRAAASGYTSEIIAARESWVSGRRGVGELTGTVQGCISLWENGLSLAKVTGTSYLKARDLSVIARSLALRGEYVGLIADQLLPANDWDVRTRDGVPVAYKLSLSEAGGGVQKTALAPEVLHIRIGADAASPWAGQSPLSRASISAGLLNALEEALREVYENVPLGSAIVPFPESPNTDSEQLSRGFKAKRGRMLLRESVNVFAAGGATPQTDWKPMDLSPNLERAMTKESLDTAQRSICSVFGVLPSLNSASATGPLVREAQRHLASWTLQPIAKLLAEEASGKLGVNIEIDTLEPLQAYDAGGRARALSTVIQAMALAKETNLTPEETSQAFALVDWKDATNG